MPGGASISNIVAVEVELLELRAILQCLSEPGSASISIWLSRGGGVGAVCSSAMPQSSI